MSWSLIRSIQRDTDLRLVMPFGLNLRVGDVISVGRDGGFTLEGTCGSLLDCPAGQPRTPSGSIGLMRQSGKNTTFKFRAAGTASALFQDLQNTKAGFDISFGSADGWVLALKGRSLTSLDDIDRFRRPILAAYRLKVWKSDWALVTSISTVERMTLIASRTSNTNVALALSGQVAANMPLEVQFTSGASILAISNEIIQCIIDEPLVAFCSAKRVCDPWWRFWSPTGIGSLAPGEGPKDPMKATADEFWEDVDHLEVS